LKYFAKTTACFLVDIVDGQRVERLVPSYKGKPAFSPGYEKGSSVNLPAVDFLMLAYFLATDGSNWSPELRYFKATRLVYTKESILYLSILLGL